MTTYGYIRTSRQRIQGTSGSDPAAQAHQLQQDGVPEANIHRDVGISGGTGTNSRAGWRALDAKLAAGDTLVVVAIDRIGRRWMDTVNAVRDLRTREVKIRSLAQSEATWVTYLAAEPDTAEAVIGDILTTFMAWAAEQELQAVAAGPGPACRRPGPRGRPWDRPRIGLTTTRSRPWPGSGGKGRASGPSAGFSEYRAPRCNGGCRKLCILRMHRLLRGKAKQKCRHGPGPGGQRRGAAGADDRQPVEEFTYAGPRHLAPFGRERSSCQIPPGTGFQGLNSKRRVLILSSLVGWCRTGTQAAAVGRSAKAGAIKRRTSLFWGSWGLAGTRCPAV